MMRFSFSRLWFALILLALQTRFVMPLSAQIREIDSLERLLQRRLEQDTTRVTILLELARRQYFQDGAAMERTARQALNTAEKLGFQRGIGDGLLQIGRSLHVRSRYTESIDYIEQAKSIFTAIGYKSGIAAALHAMGNTFLDQADFNEALKMYLEALTIREQLGEKRAIAATLNNLGILYKQQGKLVQALEYYRQSLAFSEKEAHKTAIASAINNIGLLYQQRGMYDSAEYFLRRSSQMEFNLGRKQGIALSLHNLGVLSGLQGNYDSARTLLQSALAVKRESKEQQSIAQTLNEISLVHIKTKNFAAAIQSASEALEIAKAINTKGDIKNAAERLSEAYKAQGNFQAALAYKELATAYRDSVFSEEKERQSNQFETKYQLSKKQIENEALRRDNVSKQRLILLAGTACVFAFAFLLYFIYANSRKNRINAELQEQQRRLEEQAVEIEITNTALQEANERSERLLLNVLPAAIAERLRAGETKIAERFENVSVLFADIAGFTPLAQQLEPVVLVAVLDEIFSTFDEIAERYGLEKIKTIGDSYMLVAGCPRPRYDHAEAIALAALAIQSQISLKNDILRRMNTKLQMRVGIHTGEVIAGVIGTKKFTYDLWGDTVNIANRMESHGVGGMIHVTEAFVQAFDTAITDKLPHSGKRRITAYPHLLEKEDIQNSPEMLQKPLNEEARPFIFEERGEIEVKGKGTMTTYFLVS